MKTGRPPLYNNPEELQIKIDEYFDKGCTVEDIHIKGTDTIIKVKRPTIGGLVLYAGFCDRQSFYDYEKHKEFTHTIKRARQKIAQHYEELLQKGLGAGAIFALKNFGWVDKQEWEGKVTGINYSFNGGTNSLLSTRDRGILNANSNN